VVLAGLLVRFGLDAALGTAAPRVCTNAREVVCAVADARALSALTGCRARAAQETAALKARTWIGLHVRRYRVRLAVVRAAAALGTTIRCALARAADAAPTRGGAAPVRLAHSPPPARRLTAEVVAVLVERPFTHALRSAATGAVVLLGAGVRASRWLLHRAVPALAPRLMADDLLSAHAAHGTIILAVRAVAKAVLLVAAAVGAAARDRAGAPRVR